MYRRGLVRNFGTSCIATRDKSIGRRRSTILQRSDKEKREKDTNVKGWNTSRLPRRATVVFFIVDSYFIASRTPPPLIARPPSRFSATCSCAKSYEKPRSTPSCSCSWQCDRGSSWTLLQFLLRQRSNQTTHLFLPRLRHSNTTSRFNRYINPFVVKRRFVFHKSRKFIWKTAGTSKVKLLDSAWEG